MKIFATKVPINLLTNSLYPFLSFRRNQNQEQNLQEAGQLPRPIEKN